MSSAGLREALIARCDDLIDRALWARSRLIGDPPVPTLMHVTHAKAGSTWINNLLEQLFHRRVAPRGKIVAQDSGGDLRRHVFAPGFVYRAMFMTRDEFLAHPELREIKRFFVMRDLRDTLVSLYFSLKISHPIKPADRIHKHREALADCSVEDGLCYLLAEELPGAAAVQSSWLGHGEIVLRYEDLLANSFPVLHETLITRLALPISSRALHRAIRRTRFESVFRRSLGEEDVTSHGRKGVAGDWKNHFTPEVRRRFAEKFGQLLIDTGYEKDTAWAR